MINAAITSNRFLSKTNPEYIRAVDDSGSVLNSPEINKLMMQMVDMDIAKNLKLWVHSGLVKTRASGGDLFVPKAYDISGEENDGVEATEENQPQLLTTGLKFDNAWLIVPYEEAETNATCTFWLKLIATTPFLFREGALSTRLNLNIWVRETTEFRLRFSRATGTEAKTSNNLNVPADEWVHIAILGSTTVRDESVYKNGVLYTGTWSNVSGISALAAGSHFQIGRISTFSGENHREDIRRFNKHLSATEILAIYNATKSKYGH